MSADAAPSPITGPDELTLVVNGSRLSGWTEIAVTRGIEQMPSAFVVEATGGSPTLRDALNVEDGAPCTVFLGPDKVITGYVDTVIRSFSPGDATVRLQGRGKCQDLVDCSAEWKGWQISGGNALAIAKKLCEPYGIQAAALCDPGPVIPKFNLNIGETPATILEKITRQAQLLYYEDAAGNLVLAQAGTGNAASGLFEGENVQQATALRSKADRFSEYTVSLMGLYADGVITPAVAFPFTATDPNVKRHRKLYNIEDQVFGGAGLARETAIWSSARRAGRGERIIVTVDSWRDRAGKLWMPNTLVSVSLPRLQVRKESLCLSRVTYRLALGTGRTAELELLPKGAFQPQPIQLQPLIPGAIGPSTSAGQ
jgi:prophage tail gpP-like protein